VLFPSLLFVSIARTRFVMAEVAPFVLTGLAALAAGVALGFLAKPVLSPQPRQFASGVQCAFRFNSYVALALAARLGGEPGLALIAVMVGFAVPLANVFAVWPLARHANAGVLSEMARNPLILATAGGVACNLVGPGPARSGRHDAHPDGPGAIALGLLAVGASLRFGAIHGARAFAAWITTVKLGAMPAVAMAVGSALALPAGPMRMAMLFAAMPTASSCYVLANRMGGDGQLVAWMVSVSTLASLLTMPLWLSATGVAGPVGAWSTVRRTRTGNGHARRHAA
jgi:predicted permease